jgi:hypothetical protein
MSDVTANIYPEGSVNFKGVWNLLARAGVAEFTRSSRAGLKPSIELPAAFNQAAINPDNIRRYEELTGDKPDANVIPVGYYFSQAFLGMATILADSRYPLPLMDTMHRTNKLYVSEAAPVDPKRIMSVGVYLRSFTQTDRNIALNFESEFRVDTRHVASMETSARFRNRPRIPSTGERDDLDLLKGMNKTADLNIPEWLGLKYAWHMSDWNKAHIATWLAKTSGLDSKTLQGACSTGIALSHLHDHPVARLGKGGLFTEYLAPVKIPGTHELHRQDIGTRTNFAIFDAKMQRVTVKGHVLA